MPGSAGKGMPAWVATTMRGVDAARTWNAEPMSGIEEAIIKVYLLQRETLRDRAHEMIAHAPDLADPPTWVVPMDVPAIDRLTGSQKPYLYFDRQRDRFTHIVHAFAVTPRATGPVRAFPVQRVITIPETQG